MTERPYLTVAYRHPFGDCVQETHHLPGGTPAERYCRSLAPSLFAARCKYQKAYFDHSGMVALVPLSHMEDDDMTAAMNGGYLLGIPVRVSGMIDKPMLAVELEPVKVPT